MMSQKKIALKENELLVSFFSDGGLGYHLRINNFVFRNNCQVTYTKEEVYFKNGKKYNKTKQKLDSRTQKRLFEIINSDFVYAFTKLSMKDFTASSINNQICRKNYVDDAPTDYVVLKQNNKILQISVYLPKSNESCTTENSPLHQFIKLHDIFGIRLNG